MMFTAAVGFATKVFPGTGSVVTLEFGVDYRDIKPRKGENTVTVLSADSSGLTFSDYSGVSNSTFTRRKIDSNIPVRTF